MPCLFASLASSTAYASGMEVSQIAYHIIGIDFMTYRQNTGTCQTRWA